jgi:hypothetical protein
MGGEDILSGRANCGLRIRGGFNIRYRVGIDKPSKPVLVAIVRNISYLADQGQSRTRTTRFGFRRYGIKNVVVFRVHPGKDTSSPSLKFCTIEIRFAKRPIQLFITDHHPPPLPSSSSRHSRLTRPRNPHNLSNRRQIRRPKIIVPTKNLHDFILLPHPCLPINLIILLSPPFHGPLTLCSVFFVAVSRGPFGPRGAEITGHGESGVGGDGEWGVEG